MHRSKKYKKSTKLIDKSKVYSIEEAITLLPKLSTAKFDSSVEIHINLNLSAKQTKETIRGSITLPHQAGSSTKIAVLTTPKYQNEAKGAAYVGGEDLIKKIEEGWSDFDVLIATPEIMPKAVALGKILGPKGKMPNPKNKTVTTELKETIESYKKGKTDFKADKQGGIHKTIGRLSMKKEHLVENSKVFLKAVFDLTKKLQSIPFKSAYLAPTMGPSVRLDIPTLLKNLT